MMSLNMFVNSNLTQKHQVCDLGIRVHTYRLGVLDYGYSDDD
jgi:hypothetical protein